MVCTIRCLEILYLHESYCAYIGLVQRKNRQSRYTVSGAELLYSILGRRNRGCQEGADFGRLVNHIPTISRGGGRLCSPHHYLPPSGFSDLPKVLYTRSKAQNMPSAMYSAAFFHMYVFRDICLLFCIFFPFTYQRNVKGKLLKKEAGWQLPF